MLVFLHRNNYIQEGETRRTYQIQHVYVAFEPKIIPQVEILSIPVSLAFLRSFTSLSVLFCQLRGANFSLLDILNEATTNEGDGELDL